MAVLITALYYKYPYSLQSLQTEVKQSNLEMGGYFTLALWSNRSNTQACRAMLALPRRKSNILVTSNTVFLHFLPAAYVKELSTRPKLGFQTSNCKGTALRNNRCRLTAKSETKHGQTGLLGTGRARGQARTLLREDADNKAKLRTTWSSCVFQRVLLSHAQYCDILKYLASGVHHKYLETLNDNSGELVHVANTLDVVVH